MGNMSPRAHARREQRLMRIAHSGIGQQHALLLLHPLREFFRAQLFQLIPRAFRNRLGQIKARQRCGVGKMPSGAFRPFISGLPFTTTLPRKRSNFVARSRRGVMRNNSGVSSMKRVMQVPDELRMTDDVFEKLQIARNTANAEFAQAAIHARDCFVAAIAPRGHFYQQRIVVRRDHRAAIRRAGVEANAEAGRAAIRRECGRSRG